MWFKGLKRPNWNEEFKFCDAELFGNISSPLIISQVDTWQPVASETTDFNKQTITDEHTDPLIQMFDATDVGILHELWMLVGHRHETWRGRAVLINWTGEYFQVTCSH